MWGAIAGAIAGSFLATLILRWEAGGSVTRGRSRCDGCGRTLRPRELVPVVSALLLRGRCAGCGAAIAPLHGQIELASAAIGAVAFAFAPPLAAATWTGLGLTLLTLAALDLRSLWLPDALTLPLAAAGLLAGGLTTGVPTLDRVVGGAIGWGALAALAWIYRRWRGVEGMGGGDPKLCGAIGCWIGWTALPALWTLAGLFGLLLLLARRHGSTPQLIPFGTALALAAWPAWALSP